MSKSYPSPGLCPDCDAPLIQLAGIAWYCGAECDVLAPPVETMEAEMRPMTPEELLRLANGPVGECGSFRWARYIHNEAGIKLEAWLPNMQQWVSAFPLDNIGHVWRVHLDPADGLTRRHQALDITTPITDYVP